MRIDKVRGRVDVSTYDLPSIYRILPPNEPGEWLKRQILELWTQGLKKRKISEEKCFISDIPRHFGLRSIPYGW